VEVAERSGTQEIIKLTPLVFSVFQDTTTGSPVLTVVEEAVNKFTTGSGIMSEATSMVRYEA